MSADDLTRFASKFKLEAAAALVQIYRDEQAPANARASAAQQILAHANGRPGIVRPVGVEDISHLDDDQCQVLFHALMRRFDARCPAFFKTLMVEAYAEALRLQAALPKPPNRFKRGPLAGVGPHVPRWGDRAPREAAALTPGCSAIRSDLSAEPAASPAQPPADPESALYAPLIASHEGAAQRGSGERPEPPPARRQASEPPDNVVVQLPGTARADRLPPYGLVYGLDTDLERSRATALNPHGGVHPSVVLRAAQKDPWRGR